MKKLLSFLLALIVFFGAAMVASPSDGENVSPILVASAAIHKPGQVKGVKATPSSKSVTLKWNKVSGATKYFVYKYSSSSKKYTYLKKATSTTAKITDLKSSTSYKFAVRAVTTYKGKDYKGNYSSVVSVKTKSSSSSSSLTPTNSDYKNLGELLQRLNYFGCKYDRSSYKTDTKVNEILFDDAPTYLQMWYELVNQLGFRNDLKAYDYDVKDPLGKFTYGMGFYKINADRMDFIYKNVFGVNNTHKSYGKRVYYYKGYCYIASGNGGDAPPVTKLVSSKKVDGKYQVKYNYDYFGSITTVTATVKLQKVDGKRVWSFYKIRK